VHTGKDHNFLDAWLLCPQQSRREKFILRSMIMCVTCMQVNKTSSIQGETVFCATITVNLETHHPHQDLSFFLSIFSKTLSKTEQSESCAVTLIILLSSTVKTCLNCDSLTPSLTSDKGNWDHQESQHNMQHQHLLIYNIWPTNKFTKRTYMTGLSIKYSSDRITPENNKLL